MVLSYKLSVSKKGLRPMETSATACLKPTLRAFPGTRSDLLAVQDPNGTLLSASRGFICDLGGRIKRYRLAFALSSACLYHST
jgi:hypothetical protein